MLLVSSLTSTLLAKESSAIKVLFQHLDFSNSTQKEQGKRHSLEVKHHIDRHHLFFVYEKTDTQTFQPPLPKNLNVNKLSFKYGYQLSPSFRLNTSYITIDDNLVATDGGKIYGVGLDYKNIKFAHYFSDYTPLDVHQSDVSVTFKSCLGEVAAKTTLMAKYLTLKDFKTHPLSKNAQSSYFTPAIKVHLTYDDYIAGLGAFFGKRVFAVMDSGVRVQHHGMEFDRSYALGFGKKVSDYTLMLKYNYARATELPKETENVQVRGIIFSLSRRF